MVVLRDYQRDALELIENTFKDGSPRATLHMPCGTGKTHVAAAALAARHGHHVFFVPSIALLSQTLRTMHAQLDGWRFIAVCSDNQVGDDLHVEELDSPSLIGVTTDPQHLRGLLDRHAAQDVLVISTYASAGVLADAQRHWSLMVLDEAHHTAGIKDRAWSIPMDDELLQARHRLFMTATTRNVRASEDDEDEFEIVSMDDAELYGPHISTISWREAIDRGILSDYEVAVVGVTDREVFEVMRTLHQDGFLVDAHHAAAQLALIRAHQRYPSMKSVLAFHNRVQASISWSQQLAQLADGLGLTESLHVRHIDAQTHFSHREDALEQLRSREDGMTVVSNCRVLSEGVDVPALDAVLFAAPRSSANDLVQIVGRALRKHPHSDDKALIIIPVIESDNDALDIDTKLVHSQYAFCWRLLIALSEIDEQVAQSVAAQMLVDKKSEPEPDGDSVLQIDTSGIPASATQAFELRVLSKLTSHHVVTVELLREYAALNGHANPKAGEKFGARDYPLGSRVRSARAAHKNKKLDRKYVALYEQVPGFEWEPKTRQAVFSDESYIELMERFVAQTGISSIRYGQSLTDAETGISVPIGKKANDWTWIKQLEPALRERFDACVKR